MQICNNQKRHELYKNLDTAADIKRKRIAWLEHLIGMDKTGYLKRYLMINQKEEDNQEAKTEMTGVSGKRFENIKSEKMKREGNKQS